MRTAPSLRAAWRLDLTCALSPPPSTRAAGLIRGSSLDSHRCCEISCCERPPKVRCVVGVVLRRARPFAASGHPADDFRITQTCSESIHAVSVCSEGSGAHARARGLSAARHRWRNPADKALAPAPPPIWPCDRCSPHTQAVTAAAAAVPLPCARTCGEPATRAHLPARLTRFALPSPSVRDS
jgi:hypothetical protein